MSVSQDYLREERIRELTQMIADRAPPRRVEVVVSTGESLSHEAMNLARLYDQANHDQRQAFDALAKAFGRKSPL
jgi:hypothetical protein